MKLGDLIRLLEPFKNENKCVILDGDYIACTNIEFMSYRGDYSDLAIDFSFESKSGNKDITSKFLYNKLLDVRNTNLIGYKGGEYVMDDEVNVYVDKQGACSGRLIIGVGLYCGNIDIITYYQNKY
jgi:hypothetical protein